MSRTDTFFSKISRTDTFFSNISRTDTMFLLICLERIQFFLIFLGGIFFPIFSLTDSTFFFSQKRQMLILLKIQEFGVSTLSSFIVKKSRSRKFRIKWI